MSRRCRGCTGRAPPPAEGRSDAGPLHGRSRSSSHKRPEWCCLDQQRNCTNKQHQSGDHTRKPSTRTAEIIVLDAELIQSPRAALVWKLSHQSTRAIRRGVIKRRSRLDAERLVQEHVWLFERSTPHLSTNGRLLRKLIHNLLRRTIRELDNLIDLVFRYYERRGKTEDVSMWHCTCNQPTITSSLRDSCSHF